MRKSPSIEIVKSLVAEGAIVNAYDPKSTENDRNYYLKETLNLNYFNNKYEALDDTEALFLLTEWKEFRSPDFNEMKIKMKSHVIFDGRNQFIELNMKERGFLYFPIGVGIEFQLKN